MISLFINKIQKLNKYEKNLSLVIFFSWLLLILSVGANSSELITNLLGSFILGAEKFNLFQFSYIRSGVVIIIFLTLLIFVLKQKNFINFKKIGLEDLFVLIFFIYIIIGFLGLNLSCNYKNNYLNIQDFICQDNLRTNYFFTLHFSIATMCLLLIYFLATTQNNNFFFLPHTLSLLSFLIILSFFLIIFNELEYGGLKLKIKFLNFVHYINSNGVGRILLILSIFLQSLYFSDFIKKGINKVLIILILIIVSSIIYSLEGKFNSLALIACFVIFNFYISKSELKPKLTNLFFIIILPIIIIQFNIYFEKNYLSKKKCNDEVSCINHYKYIKKENSNRLFKINKVFASIDDQIANYQKTKKRHISKETDKKKLEDKDINKNINNPDSPYLNTRILKWRYLLNDFSKRKYYLGNGPEYDRQLLINLANVKGMTSNSGINSDSANGFIYGILTSGIFGVILYFFACFYTLIIMIKYHLSKTKKKSVFLNFAFLCLLIVMARSLIENGFMSWNFDQFLLIGSLIILKFKANELSSIKILKFI